MDLKTSKHTVLLLIIFVIGSVAYANSLDCSFQFDDFKDIVDNPAIRSFGNNAAWARYAPSRMIAMFTFVVNYQIHELHVLGYHMTNILIHIVTAALVYVLIFLTVGFIKKMHPWMERRAHEIALFGGLIFVSHPVQTQAVTYIVQRMASLATLFYVAALVLHILGRTLQTSQRRRTLLFSGVILSSLLAMLTKQIAFTLPVMIGVYEWMFLRDFTVRNHRNKQILAACLLAICLIVPMHQHFNLSVLFRTIPPQQGHTASITAATYMLTQLHVIVTYLRLLFFPINQQLDYDYPLYSNLFQLSTLLSAGLLVALMLLAILSYKKYRLITFGIIWFFITLSIESSIIPLPNVIFEHRVYLPSIGFIFLLAGVYNWLQLHRFPAQSLIIISSLVIVCTVLTVKRNEIWRTEMSMWDDNVKKAPDNVRARTIRGKLFAKAGDYNAALEDLHHALSLNPNYENARLNLGVIYAKQGQFNWACNEFETILRDHPDNLEAHNNLANVLMAMKQFQQAIENYNTILSKWPDKYEVYVNRGIAYAELNNFDNAVRDFNTSISLNPKYDKAYLNRSNMYMQMQEWQAAFDDLNRVLELSPANIDALIDRGTIYLKLHQFSKALFDFNRVIELDDTNGHAYARRALTFYLQHNTNAMLRDIKQAQQLGMNVSPAKIQQYAALFEH
ncbi:tetratricopeptide repeat protein [candidate division KSB1 bacterium]|nr:tetratricopeptide repeat protein [candidate division KSB1 bacterium]